MQELAMDLGGTATWAEAIWVRDGEGRWFMAERTRELEMEEALRLVLLWHSAAPWDEEKRAEWKAATGSPDATTAVLCDHIRKVLKR